MTNLPNGARLIAAAALALTALSSQAAVYLNKTSFLSANAGLSLQDFEGCNSSTCAVPAFTGFSVTGPNVVIADGPTFGAPSDWLADNTFNGNLGLAFSPTINAVGFNLSAGFGGGNMIISIFSGATLLDTQVVATTGIGDFTSFFGIDGLGGISNLNIVVNNQANFVNIDNLYFGTTNVVPEPTSLALVGLGLAAAGIARRRKQVKAA